MTANSLTQERLKELLRYNPETGVFAWKTSRGRVKAGDRAGYFHHHGYILLSINGKKHQAHRLAWLYVKGKWPNNQIDHINHIRTDNRIDNLRSVDRYAQMQNRVIPITNTSGVIGVSRHTQSGKWRASITYQWKVVHLGTFDDKNDAIIARKMAEVKYGFHENHGTEL